MSAVISPEPVALGHASKRGEPTWEVATLFPVQGQWTEAEYLALNTNRIVELVDGCLEIHPMAAPWHQRIVKYLLYLLNDFVTTRMLGEVLFAPLPVWLWAGQMREPDLIYFASGRIKDDKEPPRGADLAMEVVSDGPKDRERDLETKRYEYAKARIPEYWIIDRQERRIIVLTLENAEYRVHGEFGPGTIATSVLLPGFTVDVNAVLAAGEVTQTTQTSPNGQ